MARHQERKESDPLILRFPEGLTDNPEHQDLKGYLKTMFESCEYEVTSFSNRLLLKPNNETFNGIIRDTIANWILQLISDPNVRKEIPTDPHHYSLSLFSNGGVYTGIMPCSNIINSYGQFEFVFQNHFYA